MMHDANHSEIEELLGAYVLDAVDNAERLLVEDHLGKCAHCQAEVDELREVAASLTPALEPAPERIWDRISAELHPAAVEPEPNNVTSLLNKRRTVSSTAFNWAIASAAAVVAVMSVTAVTQSSRIADLNDQLAAQEQEITTLALSLKADPLERAVSLALDDPSSQIATLTADGASGAMLIVVLPDGTGYVYESTLDQLPDDLTYQLWAVIDDKVISAGILGNQPDIVPFHIDPEGLQALVITQEVYGGVPQSEGEAVVAWFEG